MQMQSSWVLGEHFLPQTALNLHHLTAQQMLASLKKTVSQMELGLPSPWDTDSRPWIRTDLVVWSSSLECPDMQLLQEKYI